MKTPRQLRQLGGVRRSPSANQCFFVSVLLVVLVVAVLGAVPIVPVVAVVAMVDVLVVSVDDIIVPVVDIVSVAIVDDVVVDVVMAVSVAAVSVFAFSCFLQPTAKMAMATIAMRVITRDFFIQFSSIVLTGGSDSRRYSFGRCP